MKVIKQSIISNVFFFINLASFHINQNIKRAATNVVSLSYIDYNTLLMTKQTKIRTNEQKFMQLRIV